VEVREEVRQMAEPLASEEGLEVVDVEQTSAGRHRIIRVYLDKPGGVTLGDCARFSRRLSDCLDMNQTVPGRYHLEVSSPGLERPLRTLEHVARFAGERAAFVTHEPRDGRRKWEGLLLGPKDGRAGLRAEDGEEHWFDWTDVKSARLVVDPWAGLRKPGPKQSPESRPRGGAR
jgi:ribosome maturation factor RimP